MFRPVVFYVLIALPGGTTRQTGGAVEKATALLGGQAIKHQIGRRAVHITLNLVTHGNL